MLRKGNANIKAGPSRLTINMSVLPIKFEDRRHPKEAENSNHEPRVMKCDDLRKLTTSDSNGATLPWTMNGAINKSPLFPQICRETLHRIPFGRSPKFRASDCTLLFHAHISLHRFLVACFAYVSVPSIHSLETFR